MVVSGDRTGEHGEDAVSINCADGHARNDHYAVPQHTWARMWTVNRGPLLPTFLSGAVKRINLL